MPITCTTDKDSGILSARAAGTITDADVAGFVDAVLAGPDSSLPSGTLLDLEDAEFGVTSSQIPDPRAVVGG